MGQLTVSITGFNRFSIHQQTCHVSTQTTLQRHYHIVKSNCFHLQYITLNDVLLSYITVSNYYEMPNTHCTKATELVMSKSPLCLQSLQDRNCDFAYPNFQFSVRFSSKYFCLHRY